jgi:hypothetical protein
MMIYIIYQFKMDLESLIDRPKELVKRTIWSFTHYKIRSNKKN